MEITIQEKTTFIPNFNNKFANDVFIHISSAPHDPVLESSMPMRVRIQEVVKNENKTALDMLASGNTEAISFDADMIEFIRLELWQIGSGNTYMSHGIDREAFVQFLKQGDKEVNPSDKYAIYIYKKVK